MSNFLALVVTVGVSFLLGVGFLVWMVRKYYWGPTGLPPSQRYKEKEKDSPDEGEPLDYSS
jgi:hypothetical protein